MLTRCAKAYSSFCLQTVSLSLATLSQFILEVCAAAEDCKNQCLNCWEERLSPQTVFSAPLHCQIMYCGC